MKRRSCGLRLAKYSRWRRAGPDKHPGLGLGLQSRGRVPLDGGKPTALLGSHRAVEAGREVNQAFRRLHTGQRADLVQNGIQHLGVRCRDLQKKIEAA